MRGDDELVRSLQDEKSLLEDRLKTADSRVRRLEDLVHREQASKQAAEQSARSGIAGLLAAAAADTSLGQRIEQLERDLAVERERANAAERDLTARTDQHDTIKGQMEEVTSVKMDLLGNMEALEREWTLERKSLEDEIKMLRSKLDEADDEMEHLGESREHDRAAFEERMRRLESEREKEAGTQQARIEELERSVREQTLAMEELRKTGQSQEAEIQELYGKVDELEQDSDGLREELSAQEREHQKLRDKKTVFEQDNKSLVDTNSRLTTLLETAESTADILRRTLHELHLQVAPTEGVPEELGDLIESLASRTTARLSQAQATENDVHVLQSNLDDVEATVHEQLVQLDGAQQRESALKLANVGLREDLAQAQARVGALEGELDRERGEMDNLRNRIADGETGSDELRRELAVAEQRAVWLVEDLAAKQSAVASLSEEVQRVREDLGNVQTRESELRGLLDGRTERAMDLSQRLYVQNDRLCRLLDRLGFVVTRQGSDMTIERLPKS